ncbi:hypothetical protein M8J75_015883 [Diaphorina citri]|nr:hypothetical protein M8J75_015883 [Diaphorina citri]
MNILRKGLGKKEDGINKALKPKLKFDTSGLGHDPGEQFTNRWWESAYNSAANNLDVKNKKSKVKIKKHGDMEISTKKSMVWRKETVEQSDDEDTNSKAEDSTSQDITPNIVQLTDEELFAACGGLTAHKAARHGHKLSGKLKRLQEQDEKISVNHKKKRRKENVAHEENSVEDVSTASSEKTNKKNKKKKVEQNDKISEGCVEDNITKKKSMTDVEEREEKNSTEVAEICPNPERKRKKKKSS